MRQRKKVDAIDLTRSEAITTLHYYPTPSCGLVREFMLFNDKVRENAHDSFVIWTTGHSLVVPRSIRKASNFELACEESQKSGWPVYVRETGGDVTPLAPGVLNIAVSFGLQPDERRIAESYKKLCAPIARWLYELNIVSYCGSVRGSVCDGIFNIVVDGRKLGGTAQRWKLSKNQDSSTAALAVLAHASIFYDADISDLVAATKDFCGTLDLKRQFFEDRHINVAGLTSLEKGHSIDDAAVHLGRVLRQAGFHPG